MIKKFFVFLLVSMLVLGSCGFEDEYSGDEVISRPPLNLVSEEESSVAITESLLEDIEGYDYKGKTFVIVTTDKEYFLPTGSGSLIDKAVSDRNGAVETKFNIKIEVKVSTADEILTEGVEAMSKGERYADLIVAPANVLARLMDEKCLTNVNTLPFLDGDSPYMTNELVRSSQINGKLYLLFSDLTQTELSPWCVFYNEDLAEKAGIDPWKLYKDGKWTWDAFMEYASSTSGKVKNPFVSVVDKNELLNVLWASTGNKFFGDCSDSALSVPKLEGGKEIISFMRKIVNSHLLGSSLGNEAVDKFTSGEAGMLLCRRDAVYEISEKGMNWGAVPMPKYNEDSEHYSYVDGEVLAVSVPKGIDDSDYVGRVLNAFFVATEKTVTKSVEQNEIYYYWSDNDMALQMEEMKKSLHLDIGLIYASAVKDVATVTTENLKTAFDANIAPFQFYHSTKNQFSLYAKEYFG